MSAKKSKAIREVARAVAAGWNEAQIATLIEARGLTLKPEPKEVRRAFRQVSKP